jgi:hypothetical protein
MTDDRDEIAPAARLNAQNAKAIVFVMKRHLRRARLKLPLACGLPASIVLARLAVSKMHRQTAKAPGVNCPPNTSPGRQQMAEQLGSQLWCHAAHLAVAT